ncbi:hypothetical protein B4102_4254 [Heyndrickxia sporothermodurans]|uniref:Uncharacterized protein n=1 Tax=Heyndrickxia sporothermodurans TaxID=46224 RepID=A0A150KJE8_9BACI|nr:hypothetical protein B4102_4254 [Heyndrickxia sporothermodurans]
MSAWIEIKTQAIKKEVSSVALYVSAWIEISSDKTLFDGVKV